MGPTGRARASLLALPVLVGLALAGCRKDAAPARPPTPPVSSRPDAGTALSPLPAGLTWASPPDWRREAFVLPPSFAPTLPSGNAEVRLAPGFTQPGSAGFWSEALLWWLPEATSAESGPLQGWLEDYFRGLCRQLGGGRFPLDAREYHAELVRVSEPATAGADTAGAFSGTLASYECQASGKPLTLHLRVRLFECPQSARRAFVTLISPGLDGAPIWHELKARAKELSCL